MTQDEYLKSGAYLPAPLRDFHDQKDVFKTMHSMIDVPTHCSELAHFNWCAGHIYVIDIFLWWMARRGWTLQRSRARIDFRDLQADIDGSRAIETAAFQKFLAERKATPPTATAQEIAGFHR